MSTHDMWTELSKLSDICSSSFFPYRDSFEINRQVPLAFVRISRHQTLDYVRVFYWKNYHEEQQYNLSDMADFERATWAALRKIIPGKDIIGCHFHWSQAVWMKVQEVELQVQYSEDINIYHTVHSIFALPFLSVANVQAGFDNIRANAVANDKLDLLLNYVKRYWMDSSTFPLSTRNVYRKETQTNNNCKGWHRRISHCAMEKPH